MGPSSDRWQRKKGGVRDISKFRDYTSLADRVDCQCAEEGMEVRVRKGLVVAVILYDHSLLLLHTQSSSYRKYLYTSSLLHVCVKKPTTDSAVEVFRV